MSIQEHEKAYLTQVQQKIESYRNRLIIPQDFKGGNLEFDELIPFSIDKDGLIHYIHIVGRGHKLKGMYEVNIVDARGTGSYNVSPKHPIITIDTRKNINELVYHLGTQTPYNPMNVRNGVSPEVKWETLTYGVFMRIVFGVTQLLLGNTSKFYTDQRWFADSFEIQKRFY